MNDCIERIVIGDFKSSVCLYDFTNKDLYDGPKYLTITGMVKTFYLYSMSINGGKIKRIKFSSNNNSSDAPTKESTMKDLFKLKRQTLTNSNIFDKQNDTYLIVEKDENNKIFIGIFFNDTNYEQAIINFCKEIEKEFLNKFDKRRIELESLFKDIKDDVKDDIQDEHVKLVEEFSKSFKIPFK